MEALGEQSDELAAWVGGAVAAFEGGPGAPLAREDLRLAAWAELPPLPRRAALRSFVLARAPASTDGIAYAALRALEDRLLDAAAAPDAAWALDLGGGVRVRRVGGVLRREGAAAAAGPGTAVVGGGVTVAAAAGWDVEVARGDAGGLVLRNVPDGAALVVRARRDGDKIAIPHGPEGVRVVAVKDVFRAAGVPRHLRDRTAVVADAATGEILAAGDAVSAAAAGGPEGPLVLRCRWVL